MEEKYGLITEIECRLVKADSDLIDIIHARTGIGKDDIKAMTRYNMFVVNQFISLTGLAESTIRNNFRPSVMDKDTGKWDTKLDFCFPFRTDKDQGPLFIVRNKKSEKYLMA